MQIFKSTRIPILFSILFLFNSCEGPPPLGNLEVNVTIGVPKGTTDQERTLLTEVLRERLLKYGLRDQDIETSLLDGNIRFHLTNADSLDAILHIMTRQGYLAFWKVPSPSETRTEMENLDRLLNSLHGKQIKPDSGDTTQPSSLEKEIDLVKEYQELQKFVLEDEESLFADDDTNTAIPDRTDESGAGILEFEPTYDDYTRVTAAIKDTGKVNECISMLQAQPTFPHQFMWHHKSVDKDRIELHLIGAQRFTRPLLEGKILKTCYSSIDANNQPVVTLEFDAVATDKWTQITERAARKREQIAVVIDNTVYTKPKVMSRIEHGVAQITGNFTEDETRLLVNALNSTLPVPVTVLSSDAQVQP